MDINIVNIQVEQSNVMYESELTRSGWHPVGFNQVLSKLTELLSDPQDRITMHSKGK